MVSKQRTKLYARTKVGEIRSREDHAWRAVPLPDLRREREVLENVPSHFKRLRHVREDELPRLRAIVQTPCQHCRPKTDGPGLRCSPCAGRQVL